MFDSVGWVEILVLIVAALFIFGPERLPGAAAALGRTVRQIKEYATGARDQLKAEMGPEFDDLRKPLEELRSIRGFDPRAQLGRAFFDDHHTGNGSALGNGSPTPAVNRAADFIEPPRSRPLDPGERPPVDPDAT